MSTEFNIGIDAAFTVEQLRAAAEDALRDLLPGPDVALRVTLPDRRFHGRYAEAPAAPPEVLSSSHGGASPLVTDHLLVTADGDAVAEVSELDPGYPEDPEGGRRLLVSRDYYREPPSHLLGIAVATAAAHLTGSPVIDEYRELTGDRLASPLSIRARLQPAGIHSTLHEAAAAVLDEAGIN